MKNFQHFLKYYRDIRKEKINQYKEILKKCYYLKVDDEIILDRLNEADQYLILIAMIIEEEVLHEKGEYKFVGKSYGNDDVKYDPFNEDYTYIKIEFPDVANVYWYNARSFEFFHENIEDLREKEMANKDYVDNFCQKFLESNYCTKEDVQLIKSLPPLDQRFLINEIHCEMDRHDINLFDI